MVADCLDGNGVVAETENGHCFDFDFDVEIGIGDAFEALGGQIGLRRRNGEQIPERLDSTGVGRRALVDQLAVADTQGAFAPSIDQAERKN